MDATLRAAAKMKRVFGLLHLAMSLGGKEDGYAGLPVLDAAGQAWLAATPPAHERGRHAQAESQQINEQYYAKQYYHQLHHSGDYEPPLPTIETGSRPVTLLGHDLFVAFCYLEAVESMSRSLFYYPLSQI